MPIDLLRFFEANVSPLQLPQGQDLAAIVVPETSGHRIGKDGQGRPCLLLRQSPGASATMPIRLANVTVTFASVCAVVDRTGERTQGTFTIVQCGSDQSLWPLFLATISTLAPGLSSSPSTDEIRRAVMSLVDLFQALGGPPAATVQGIWAELFLISVATDPTTLATAWHADPTTRFDFSRGHHRIEVKSSGRRERRHHFTLEQVTPPASTQAVVASIYVERAGGGTALKGLFENVCALLEHDPLLWASFTMSFYRSLGSGWAEALADSFDWELARESLAFFPMRLIPRPQVPASGEVTEVRFVSDLTALSSIADSELGTQGGLLAAAAPKEWRNG